MDLEFYEVNIPKMINSCIDLFNNDSNVEFSLSNNLINENCLTLGLKLQKVLSNVIDNAIQFNDKESKKVAISILENESHYQIIVADNGPGIPEEVAHKIFTIFSRSHCFPFLKNGTGSYKLPILKLNIEIN